MSDLQAKYNALLRKFIGDSTLAIDGDTENELAKDIATAMKEKAKRNAEVQIEKIQKELKRGNDALQALAEESQRLGLYDMELPK